MAAENAQDDATPIGGSPIRPSMHGHRVLEMDAIGWIMFIALLILVIPLLPLLVLIILIARVLGWGSDQQLSWS